MHQPAAALTPNTVEAIAAMAVVATLAVSVAIVVGGILRRGLQSLLHDDTPRERTLINGVVRLTRTVTFLVLVAVLAFPALDIAGLFGTQRATVRAAVGVARA